MARKHANILLLLVLLISKASGFHEDIEIDDFEVGEGITEYRPMMQLGIVDDRTMGKLSAFQVCLECKCCMNVSDPTTCSNMPCCFGIDCQLPNKPFGVCGFVPRTCNCTSCGSS
ncbi:uncharacterized protein LOC111885771 [Lactuca sativa]|uniref:uncharacterized protein LOC111885771 n=1 Tax=Lactuca sativa TaxID=4236 RepID=UPI000CD85625|nr:uncharacterized protein LOC111885771 [Lactuca sativa]